MPRKRNLTNIRGILEGIVELREAADRLKPEDKMPPAYHEFLVQLALLSRAAIRKREATKTRKDFYVEAQR